MSIATAVPVEPYASLAPVYDRLVGDAGFGPIWRAFSRSRARYGIQFRSVADVGCGTGRFLARLARDPRLRLFGVDRSRAMLAVARRRLRYGNVMLLEQDMKRLALPAPVDLLTINFASLNYLMSVESLLSVLQTFGSNLRCQGHLVLDIILTSRSGVEISPVRQLIRSSNVHAVWDVRRSAYQEGTVVTTNTCLRRANVWRCAREVHVQRWWPAAVLIQVLERAGFRVRGFHRMSDHGRPSRDDQWVQVVARWRG